VKRLAERNSWSEIQERLKFTVPRSENRLREVFEHKETEETEKELSVSSVFSAG
jgi:hypothetical protein